MVIDNMDMFLVDYDMVLQYSPIMLQFHLLYNDDYCHHKKILILMKIIQVKLLIVTYNLTFLIFNEYKLWIKFLIIAIPLTHYVVATNSFVVYIVMNDFDLSNRQINDKRHKVHTVRVIK